MITILLNAVLMRTAPAWVNRRRMEKDSEVLQDPAEIQRHVVICGFGRIGSLVGTALETFSVPYVVVEIDPDIVHALRARGIPCIFGNAAHLSILKRTHVEEDLEDSLRPLFGEFLVLVMQPRLPRALHYCSGF